MSVTPVGNRVRVGLAAPAAAGRGGHRRPPCSASSLGAGRARRGALEGDGDAARPALTKPVVILPANGQSSGSEGSEGRAHGGVAARGAAVLGLSGAELDKIARVAVPRRYEPGSIVLREGDPGDTCYVLQRGRARVTRQHADGRTITLTNLGPGEIFGELAMFGGEVRSATVEALDDVQAVAILAADLKRLLNEHPEIAVKLLGALGEKLREANARIARQSFQKVSSRVAGVLAELAETGSRSPARDGRLDGAAARGRRALHPGRPGPARRHLAGGRQPVPGHAPAGRRRDDAARAASSSTTLRPCTGTSIEPASPSRSSSMGCSGAWRSRPPTGPSGDPFEPLDVVTLAIQVGLAILLWPLLHAGIWRSRH